MEHAEGSIDIEAPLADVMEVIEDYESYPEWADVDTVEIRERGQGGRATEVFFTVDVPVLGTASYVLRYQYAPGDTAVSWATKEARGTVREIRGEYLLDERDDGTTRVTYRLGVERGGPGPGFSRTEGARRFVENALGWLMRRVEIG